MHNLQVSDVNLTLAPIITPNITLPNPDPSQITRLILQIAHIKQTVHNINIMNSFSAHKVL